MIKLIVFAVVTVVIIKYLFPAIQVVGDSMYPTYKDGEVIFGTRLYRKSKLKVGDVILYHSPDEEGKVVIKRIATIDTFGKNNKRLAFYCLGDNSECSHDSRYYGFVNSKRIVCKVINQRTKEEQ